MTANLLLANMARLLAFLVLSAVANAQIIYPDQYEMMRTSTVPPYLYTQRGSLSQQPVAYSIASNSVQQRPSYGIQQGKMYSPAAAYAAPASDASSLAETLSQRWGNHVNDIISKGVMKFTLDMDRAIDNTIRPPPVRENIIYSPLSLAVTLAMVLLGSAGRTFDETAKVLGFEAGVDISRHSEVVHQMFGLILSIIDSRVAESPGPRVNVASGIFVQDGYPIRPEFRSITENVYRSEVINLDFYGKPVEAQNKINAWVKEKTMQKISSLLSGPPDRITKVIIASALYFNGEWNQHFIDGNTKRKPFFIEPNETVDVDLMYNGGTFPFYEDKGLGVKILELPYKGQEFSMYILLPKAQGAGALRDFKSKLTRDTLEHLIQNMKNETCIVGLPRMKLESTLTLRDALKSIGLESLFNPTTADLSLLSPGYDEKSQTGARMMSAVTPGKQRTGGDVLVFSRFGEEDGGRRNFFKYHDKVGGHTVEQWATGFFIRKERVPRRARSFVRFRRSKQQENNAYEVPKSGDETVKVVNLEDNKYRFEKPKNTRSKRQSRPMDQEFLDFIKSQNFPNYGLDDLRNSANIANPGLFAAEVLHKVKIDINEKGTEAAAATAVLLERDGNQKRLIANRPFIFFIRHNPSNLLLFWGTVNTPTPNYAVSR